MSPDRKQALLGDIAAQIERLDKERQAISLRLSAESPLVVQSSFAKAKAGLFGLFKAPKAWLCSVKQAKAHLLLKQKKVLYLQALTVALKASTQPIQVDKVRGDNAASSWGGLDVVYGTYADAIAGQASQVKAMLEQYTDCLDLSSTALQQSPRA